MKKIVQAIKAGESFAIATHINPDGDALGSAIALAMALESIGKKVMVYDRDGVPLTYDFLPGAEMVSTNAGELKADTLILVDCNNLTRAGLNDCGPCKTTIVIDHHETENDFGDIKWIEPETPATGIMVLRLIRAMGIELTKDMAQNLYTAISLDTGTFRYSNTTAEALRAGAELTDAGAEPGFVADRLYSNWSNNRFALFRLVLETLEMGDGLCFMKIPTEMIAAVSATQADTENFVNFPLLMDSIMASVLLKEMESGTWKVSMRSKGGINVALIAEKFDGGGHRNAAGCTIEGKYDDVKTILARELKNSGASS